MNLRTYYQDSSTGLRVRLASEPSISLEVGVTGKGLGADQTEFYARSKFSGLDYDYVRHIDGLMEDIYFGGQNIPSGVSNGCGCLLAADVSAAATEIQLEHYLKPNGEPVLLAGKSYWLMHRRPRPHERISCLDDTDFAAELITISAAYDYTTDTGTGNNDGHYPTVSAVATGRKRWAWLELATPPVSSYDQIAGFTEGLIIEKERPTAITTLSQAETGTTTTSLALTWTKSSDKAVRAYGLYVLKVGESLSPYSTPLPVSLSEEVTISQRSGSDAVFELDDSNLTDNGDGTVTVTTIDRYYKPSDRTLAALVTGTNYIVAVRAMTGTTFDQSLRQSNPTFVLATTT